MELNLNSISFLKNDPSYEKSGTLRVDHTEAYSLCLKIYYRCREYLAKYQGKCFLTVQCDSFCNDFVSFRKYSYCDHTFRLTFKNTAVTVKATDWLAAESLQQEWKMANMLLFFTLK
jgi:hypothetical protein